MGAYIPKQYHSVLFYPVALGAVLLSAREVGLLSFYLPERRCQTEKHWSREFDHLTVSIMWGLHIGIGFATRITYGGFWLLVLVIVAFGVPKLGIVLMLSYWIGRTLSVWLAPILVPVGLRDGQLLDIVSAGRPIYHRIVAICLGVSGIVAVYIAMQGAV